MPPYSLSSPPNPSISNASFTAASETCFFEPLPRCDFGLRFFFFALDNPAAARFATQLVHVHVRGCFVSDLW